MFCSRSTALSSPPSKGTDNAFLCFSKNIYVYLYILCMAGVGKSCGVVNVTLSLSPSLSLSLSVGGWLLCCRSYYTAEDVGVTTRDMAEIFSRTRFTTCIPEQVGGSGNPSPKTVPAPLTPVVCCAVLCGAVLCCAVLCCAVLCCAVCCAVRCGAVLCCVMGRRSANRQLLPLLPVCFFVFSPSFPLFLLFLLFVVVCCCGFFSKFAC